MEIILPDKKKTFVELEKFIQDSMIISNMDNFSNRGLRKLLSTVNINFTIIGLNRLQSMLICELKDSYVQQSQRYVAVDNGAFYLSKDSSMTSREHKNLMNKTIKFIKDRTINSTDDLNMISTSPSFIDSDELKRYHSLDDFNTLNDLMNDAVDLYKRMSVLNDPNKKGRLKPSDYVYGIPYEDARYILPLACTTNLTICMTADKLLPLMELCIKHSGLFSEFKMLLDELIPSELCDKIYKLINSHKDYDDYIIDNYFCNEFEEFQKEDNSPIKIVSKLHDPMHLCTIGALTSTNDDPILKCDNMDDDSKKALVSRVLDYNHTSITEQARYTFITDMSLTAYHQFIRHRLQNIVRETIFDITERNVPRFSIPESILNSPFIDDYLDIVYKIHNEMNRLKTEYSSISNEYLAQYLLNCDMIAVKVSINMRSDIGILQERLCGNASMEIRELMENKYDLISKECPSIYIKGVPSCVYGKCKEGNMSCGRSEEMKQRYTLN